MALVVTSTITATAEIYLGKQVSFFQEEKRCFYRTKLIQKSRSSYTAAPHLKQNRPDCVCWEGDAVHRLKSLFFFFAFSFYSVHAFIAAMVSLSFCHSFIPKCVEP